MLLGQLRQHVLLEAPDHDCGGQQGIELIQVAAPSVGPKEALEKQNPKQGIAQKSTEGDACSISQCYGAGRPGSVSSLHGIGLVLSGASCVMAQERAAPCQPVKMFMPSQVTKAADTSTHQHFHSFTLYPLPHVMVWSQWQPRFGASVPPWHQLHEHVPKEGTGIRESQCLRSPPRSSDPHTLLACTPPAAGTPAAPAHTQEEQFWSE